jgi:hypothetical protein
MDIGTTVSWIQAALWTIALVIFIGKLLTGAIAMPKWMVDLPKSNVIIGTVITLGLIMSAWSLFRTDVKPVWSSESGYTTHFEERFENQIVVLDGQKFIACKFMNVTLQWNGEKGFVMGDNIFAGSVKMRIKDQSVNSFIILLGQTKRLQLPDGSSFSKDAKDATWIIN